MGNAGKKSSWTITLQDGAYVLKATNGYLGSDGTDEGNRCYGNKGTDNANSLWIIAVASEEVAIENVASEKKSANNISYNLAGQIVDENYKGIIIMNGKKILRK